MFNMEPIYIDFSLMLICSEFDVDVSDIKSTSRNRHLCLARFATAKLLNDHFNISTQSIAATICRDRTSVIYALKVAENEIRFNPSFRLKFESIVNKITTSHYEKNTI